MTEKLIARLDERSQIEVFGLGVVLVVLVAAADLATGADMAFSFFYLVPVVGTAWFASRASAAAVALLAGAAFPISDILAGQEPTAAWIVGWNFAVRSGTYLVVAALTGALRRALDHERQLARVDPLTGTLNARSFLEVVEQELARARRTTRPLTIAYLDLDGFKGVNDTFGHAAGDDVLQQVAGSLRSGTRHTDVVGRLGGDEFAVVLAETGADDALYPLGRIQAAVTAVADAGGYELSASIGAATFVQPPDDVDEALRAADELMYEAKREGKNRINRRVVTPAAAQEPAPPQGFR